MSRRVAGIVAIAIIATTALFLGAGVSAVFALMFIALWNHAAVALDAVPVTFNEAWVYCGLLVFATAFVGFFARRE